MLATLATYWCYEYNLMVISLFLDQISESYEENNLSRFGECDIDEVNLLAGGHDAVGESGDDCRVEATGKLFGTYHIWKLSF